MNFRQFIPAIAWFLMSLILLCLPGSAIPKHPFLTLIHADKWIHIGLFAMLCVLFSFPFRHSSLTVPARGKWFFYIAVIGSMYGIIMEFVQKYWIPNRSFELMDILADSTGCVAGWLYSRRKFTGSL